MEDVINEKPNWRSPSGLKSAMDNLSAHMDMCRSLLTDSSDSVPSAELVGALYAADVKTRKLLELLRKGFDDEPTHVGRREADGENVPWRGQESGRRDHLPGGVGHNPRYKAFAEAKQAAKAAFKAGRRSRPRRRARRR